MVTAWGERLYAQTTGVLRDEIGKRLDHFQHLLYAEQNPYKAKKWKRKMESFFKDVENYLNDVGIDWGQEDIDSWYVEESEDNEEQQEEDWLWYNGHLTH